MNNKPFFNAIVIPIILFAILGIFPKKASADTINAGPFFPITATDTTHSPINVYDSNSQAITQLANTDCPGLIYTSFVRAYSWPKPATDFDPTQYIEFGFNSPNIPSNAIIDNVTLVNKYWMEVHIDAARFQVWDGSSFTSVNADIPNANGCNNVITNTIDITSILNTPDKVNSLKLRFSAYRTSTVGSLIKTDTDYLAAFVSYHLPDVVTTDSQSVFGSVDTPIVINLTGTSTDGNPLTYSIVDNPTNGDLSSINGNQVTYTTKAGTIGDDSFTFKANDTVADSATSTITLHLSAGSTTSLSISANPTTLTVGSSTTLTISGKDKYGNISTNDNSTSINISSDTGTTTNSVLTLSLGEAITQGEAATSGVVNYTAITGDGSASSTVTVTYNPVITLPTPPTIPISSLTSGTYTSTQNITLSTSDGADIYYTTDGTVPACNSSAHVTGAIAVSTSQTIKAIACDSFGQVSDIASFEYIINITTVVVSGGGGGGGSSGGGGLLISHSSVPALPGDINGDGKVDIFDLNIVFSHWGENYAAADFNNDGVVDILDFNYIMANWTI